MRNLYLKVVQAMVTTLTLGVGTLSFGQINYTQNWNTAGLNSWTAPIGNNFASFARTTSNPCEGSGSVRGNVYASDVMTLVSPALTGTNGAGVTVGFSYKVVDYDFPATDGASLADLGTIQLQWATSNTGPWTTVYTINSSNHTVSASCATISHAFSGLPNSGNVYIRFVATATSLGDNYVYIDNVSVIQLVPPAAPPVPTEVAGTPSCATGTNINVSGTPGTDVAWYWQGTNANGTSTANAATSDFNAPTNGTYYVRAFNSVNNLWSSSSSIVINSIPTAPTPPIPTGVTPACLTTTLTAATPPSNTTYYWQTAAGGTSNVNNATTPLTVTTTGTYYLSAFDAVTSCWSSTSSMAVTIDTYVPEAPTATTEIHNICVGATSQEIEAIAQGSSSVNVVIGTNLSNSASLTVPFTVPALPAGAVITSAQLQLTNVNAVNGSWRSEILVGLSGGYTLAATQISALGSGGLITPDPTINLVGFPVTGGAFNLLLTESYDDPGVVDATFGEVRIVINYTLPASTITWYDASTNGNNLGTGSPFESVGTAILSSPATAGTYEFYAESVSGGCVSVTRTLVTVNVDPVNVELVTIDATCNNGNDGAFALGPVACGTVPFSYAIDGGTFTTITSGLSVGIHTVVVRDANNDLSAEYTITIGSAAGPSDVQVISFTDVDAVVVWNSNGSETEWNIEWGLPGFTPGTGTSLGFDTSLDTTFTVTGLDAETEYEIYVSANCGSGTTTGDWSGTSVITDCGPVSAPWCEDFEPTTGTFECWTKLDLNNDGYTAGTGNWPYAQWALWNNTDVDEDLATSGVTFATNFNQGQTSADDWLITPRISLTGNEVLKFNYVTFNDPSGFRVLLSTTGKSPADFTEVLMAQNTYSNIIFNDTTVNLSAYNTDVYIAFVRSGTTATYTGVGIDDVCIDICNPIAGTDGVEDVCRTAGTVDLNSVITTQYTTGSWIFPANQSVISGSTMNVSTLANGTYDIYYIVEGACSSDTTVASITVGNPSSAGINGLLTVCKSQFIDLYGGLNGAVDHGGTWYAPNGTPMASSYFQTGTLSGQFVYKYIVSNGICGPDTAEVTVDIQNCVGLEDLSLLENVTIAPNPNTGNFQIIGVTGADYTFEVLDVNGRVVRNAIKITSTITDVNLTDVENGVYMIRIFGNNAERMMRVIKH